MHKYGRHVGWAAVIVIILSMGLAAPALIQEKAPADLLKAADEMVQKVQELRGLQAKSPVQMGVKSREEIAKSLDEHVREDIDEGELQSEGRLLHKLGLLPPSVDYKDFTLKLLTEQVGGYYDPDKKTFFIAGWLPVDQQKPVMVHELTHALQDQYFNLNKTLKEDRKLKNDDRVLARQAIFEGDGMAVMLNFLLQPAGREFSSLPNLVFIMQSQFSAMDSQFPIFKNAPVFMRETLLFPYGYGAAFLQRVWAKSPSWDAVNKIYSDLPVSTEQIMHPEKYLDTPRDDPKPVEFEDPVARLKGWKASYRNVLGELSIDLLLRLQLSEEQSKRAAAGWGGDQVLLLENDSGKNAAFIATTWDTTDDVEEFYQAMSTWLVHRYSKAHKSSETADGFSLIQDGEYSSIHRDGMRVQALIGLPEAESAKLK
ncbi:MAG TPA: hypothetical protein VE398_08210 [Acidobacteriota bacterium]|nr:hypothetical protein [Acidobacteriota bacterium]